MAIVFLDKVAGLNIESVVGASNFKNGQFLKLGVLGDDGESRVVTAATGNEDADVLLACAPISYDLPDFDLAKWELTAGKAGRAYHLVKGDVLRVSYDLVADSPTAGDTVDVGDSGLGFKKNSSGTGIGLVIGIEEDSFNGKLFVIAIR